MTTGGSYALQWIGYVLASLLMVVSAMKFAVICSTEGRIQFSIPQMVLFFCFCTGVFTILNAISGIFGQVGIFYKPACVFFEFWLFACAYSGLLILGLYFREVSTLTSSSSGFLSRLAWPTLILVVVFWAVILTNSFVTTFAPASLVSVGGGFVTFTFAVFVVASVALTFVFGWGIISLALSLNPSHGAYRALVVVIVQTSVAYVVLVTSTLIYLVVDLFIGGWGGPIGYYANGYQYQQALEGLSLVAVPIAMMFVAFLFRVQMSKEIEISKSGTSSTSDSRSSSSSSSSSSKTDPVIEL